MQRLDTIRAIQDPAARARAAHAANAAAHELALDYRDVLTDAVRELRQTMSLAEVAAELGVSRARVQKLENPPTRKR